MKAAILESSPYLHSSSKTTSYLQMRSLAHALRHPRSNKSSKKTTRTNTKHMHAHNHKSIQDNRDLDL
jgi:hypothetical protein